MNEERHQKACQEQLEEQQRFMIFNGGTCTWRSQLMRHVKRARNIGKKGVLFIVQKEGKVSMLFQGRGV